MAPEPLNIDAADVNSGLEAVVVAATAISNVQGLIGDLTYRGKSIDYWVEQDFADVAAAVLDLSRQNLDADLASLLFTLGELSDQDAELVLAYRDSHPMAVLQGVVPLLSSSAAYALASQLEIGDAQGRETLIGISIAARLPHVIATLIAGKRVVYAQDPDYILRFLKMLGHSAPTALQYRALSVVQILQLEHSLNAGTFAARVTASTQAGLPAALSSAFGALSGVLHGGADQAAIEMADRVGSADAAEAFVAQCLAAGEKIMGMGHREYKVVDPRAVHVKKLAEELARGTEHQTTFATLEAVEAAFADAMARRNKPVHANLEFYKGLVYRALGAPDRAFTGLFAMARVFGYIAHVLESRTNSRIIRPAALYVGV